MDSPPPQTSERYRNWLNLPRNLTLSILGRLDVVDILNSSQKVCLLWRNICKDPSMWRVIKITPRFESTDLYDYEKMCRHAVDRSCGQLVEIYVDGLPCSNSDFLKHIASSSRLLRRLVLKYCIWASDKDLAVVAASFPLLEELEVDGRFSHRYLDELGRHCPHLRSFSLWTFSRNLYKTCDLSAIAIAKNMPELVNLELFGFDYSCDGVQAILDGCPRLQSLLLQAHGNVSRLRTSYLRRFSERIKDVRIISNRKELEEDYIALKTLCYHEISGVYHMVISY